MGPRQRAYFKARLLARRAELQAAGTEGPAPRECGDATDHAVAAHAEAMFWRQEARRRAALERVDGALRRISDGSYGYCAKSGQPIGLARLEADPTATYALDVQARMERARR